VEDVSIYAPRRRRAPPRPETGRCDGFDRRLDFASVPRVCVCACVCTCVRAYVRVRRSRTHTALIFVRLFVINDGATTAYTPPTLRAPGPGKFRVVRSLLEIGFSQSLEFYGRHDFRTFRVLSNKRTRKSRRIPVNCCLSRRNVRTV